MKYISDCPGGICKLDKSETRRVNPTKTTPTHRVCKYHSGKVIAVERDCRVCGDVFQTGYGTRIAICNECVIMLEEEKKARADLRAKLKRANAKKRLKPIKTKPVFKKVKKKLPVRAKTKYEKFSMGWRRGYCKKALTCVKRDCVGCEGFVPILGQYDPAKLPVVGNNLR